MNPVLLLQTVLALAELVERLARKNFDTEAELEAYIQLRNEVRRQLVHSSGETTAVIDTAPREEAGNDAREEPSDDSPADPNEG
jgi:hypothetical protein